MVEIRCHLDVRLNLIPLQNILSPANTQTLQLQWLLYTVKPVSKKRKENKERESPADRTDYNDLYPRFQKNYLWPITSIEHKKTEQ